MTNLLLLLMKIKVWKKFVSIILSLSLLTNSLFAPLIVLAQEISPSPTPTPTIAPTEEPSPSPEVSPSSEAVVTPEVSPSFTPTDEPAPISQDESVTTPTPDSAPTTPGPPEETEVSTETASATPTITPLQPIEEGELSTTLVQEGESYPIEVLSYDGFTITTDKLDYAPTDTAVITGRNFTSGETYTLTVSSTDEPATSTTVSVTADENGEFVYAYQLDGTYRPNYLVEVKSGEVIFASTTFTDSHIASHECTDDLQGANDEPGQKDLNMMCVDETNLPTSVDAEWNWDETGWSGKNTGDACALFDTDGDGFANFASCVTVEDNPAVQASNSPRIYTCNDTKADRCAGDSLVAGPYDSTCDVSIVTPQTFPSGDDSPNDTNAQCTIQLDEVGGASVAELIDVCSYPSQQPNSDPSDCIIFAAKTGRLEVIKDLISADSGLFNLQIGGITYASDIGDGGTTGEQVLGTGASGAIYTVGETAGTGTDLSDYSTSIECRDVNGTGSVVASSSDSGPLNVTLNEDDDIVCTITNTLQNGTVVVHKYVEGPVGEDIFDDSEDFTVQLDGANDQTLTDDETVTYNDVSAGPHTITESFVPSGYIPYSITPDSNGGTEGAQITVVAGETTDVYIVNRVEAQPELGTAKTLTSAETAFEGDTVTFEIEITNTGNVTLYNPVVYDIYDADYLQYVSSSPISEDTHSTAVADSSDYDGDGDTTELIRTLSWVLPEDLDPGDTYTITLTFTAIQYTDDSEGTTYTGNEAWTEACLEDTGECSEEDEIVTDPFPAVVDIDALGSVSGYKFVDANGDGQWGDEGALGGVTINLYLSDGEGGYDLVGSGVTEGDGSYSLGDLATGDYKVCEEVPTGYAQTFPGDDGCHYFSVTDNGEDFEDRNFGNRGGLSIFGYKYEDENADGVDGGDWTTVEGLLVELWQWLTDWTFVTDTNTDSSGYYEFTNLVPGIYEVREVLSSLGSDWTNVTPTESGNIELAGEDEQHDFVNTQYGHIIIQKNAVPDSDQEFIFNNDFDNGNPSTFGLVDDSTSGLPSYDAEVLPGTYSVSEDPVSGWESPESVSCDDGSSVDEIEVSSGETVTCTFTNEKLATITLVKNTIGGDATFDFEMTGEGLPASTQITTSGNTGSETFNDLDPDNTYTISETVPAGWDLTGSECTGTTNTPDEITPNAGEEITCTFTNQGIGSITIIKDVVPDDESEWFFGISGPNEFGDDFSLFDDGNQVYEPMPAGAYTINEEPDDNYTTTWECAVDREAISSGQGTEADFELNPGQNVFCTFTNEANPGSIGGTKWEDVNGDGTRGEGDEGLIEWPIYLFTEDGEGGLGDRVGDPVYTDEDGNYTFEEVSVGDYFVCEGLPGDWTQTYPQEGDETGTIEEPDLGPVCWYVEMTAGENETEKDFGNFQTGMVQGFKYGDVNGNGSWDEGEDFLNDWEVCLSNDEWEEADCTTTHFDEAYGDGYFEFINLLAGNYFLEETEQGGYEKTEPTGDGYDIEILSRTGREEEPNFYYFGNAPLSDIHGFKWNDENGDGSCGLLHPFLCEEERLEGWTINLYKLSDEEEWVLETSDITDDGGWYVFENLIPGDYRVCEEGQDGWDQTYPSGSACHEFSLPNGSDQTENEIIGPEYDFGNQESSLGVSIEKSNDKAGGASAGDTVTYTLVVTNTGKQTIYGLDIIDALPGGFSYVSGSTTGATTADPTVSGSNLTWGNVVDLAGGELITIQYQVKIASDAVVGTYKNFATCRGDVQSKEEVVECDPDDSDVPIGQGRNFGGNLTPQVLGLATELPATGSATAILVLALVALGLGIVTKKYAKN